MAKIKTVFFLLLTLSAPLIFPNSSEIFAEAYPIGVVEHLQGATSLHRKGVSSAVEKTDDLFKGDVVTTGPKGKANVLLSMGNELSIFPASSVTFDRTSASSFQQTYKIIVDGTIKTSLKNGDTSSFQFSTPHALIDGNGAKFELTTGPEGTRIHLLEGTVELITQNNGYYAELSAKVPLGANTTSILATEKITIKVDEEMLPPEPIAPKPQIKMAKPQEHTPPKEAPLEIAQTQSILRVKPVPTKNIKAEKQPDLTNEPALLTDKIAEVPEKEEEEQPEEEGSIVWEHSLALGTFAISYWLGQQEVSKYNDLSSKNDSIQSQYDASTDTSERASLASEYNVNKEKMKTHEKNITLYNQVALVAFLLEGYFVYRDFWGDGWFGLVQNEEPQKQDLQVRSYMDHSRSKVGITFNWRW